MRRDPSILCQQEPLAVLYVPDYFDLALGSVVVFGDAGWVDLQLRDATFQPSTFALPVTYAQRD